MRGFVGGLIVAAIFCAAEARATSCADAIKNGNETDVDCGGNACPRCTNGRACLAPLDCASFVCLSGKCAPPSCVDGVKNGNETDVDCGGSCVSCSGNCGCLTGRDCLSGICV